MTTEEPVKVNKGAYWATYCELAKKDWASWRKVWVTTQISFLLAFAVHYLWLRKEIAALANLEVHALYVVLPSLLGLIWLLVVNLIIAPFRMAKTIEEDRDRLREQVAVQDEQPQLLRTEGLKFQQWLKDASRTPDGLRGLLTAAANRLDSTLGEPEGDRLFECVGEQRESGKLYQRLSYEPLAKYARDYLLAKSSDTKAMPVSCAPDGKSALTAVEAVLKDAVDDCVETMNRFGGKAPESQTEPRCRALDELMLLAVLGEKLELYKERGQSSNTQAPGLGTRYDLIREHFLDSLTVDEVNPHCGVSSWNEWKARHNAGTTPPSNRKRLEIAKKLFRDAGLEFRKEVLEAKSSRETAMEYFKLIHGFVTAVAEEAPTMKNYFNIQHGDSHWHRMDKAGGACCEHYAANLSNVGEQLRLPSADTAPPFLRPEFMPKGNAGWRDYAD